jgi:hypothetical protein
MDFPGRLTAGFLAVILIIMFPLQYIAGLNSENIDSIVDDKTHKFTDTIRDRGYLDKQMYEEFADFLDTTGDRYDIELQDIKPVMGEDICSLETKTGSNKKTMLTKTENTTRASFISTNEMQSLSVHTHNDEPDKSLVYITALPASQIIQKYTLPSFTVQANYSDGTNKSLSSSDYYITGFDASKTGLQNLTISYTEDGITASFKVSVTVTLIQKECHKCYNSYELNSDDTDPGCPYCNGVITGIEVNPDYIEVVKGTNLPIKVFGVYNDGSKKEVTGWTSNYNPERLGLQTVTIEFGGYGVDITVWVNERLKVCSVCGTEYLISEENCPVCTKKVVSINVSLKEISVFQYETIPLTVTASYADGSTGEIDDWSIDRTTLVPGTFTATVSYMGLTDTITLTVLSVNVIECPICGTLYDLSESPKGCPICSNELIGIEAHFTNGSNLVQLGTTPDIAIILIFRDEHREFAHEGYIIEDFNPRELGLQTIRIIYKEFSVTIAVEVVNMLDTITCPNEHVYYKNNDGTDPGCPFCHIGNGLSNISYFDITYTSEILDTVYSVGMYYFDEGNYVSIIVIKKDKSLLYRLQNTFFSTSLLGRKKRFIYGGEVH